MNERGSRIEIFPETPTEYGPPAPDMPEKLTAGTACAALAIGFGLGGLVYLIVWALSYNEWIMSHFAR